MKTSANGRGPGPEPGREPARHHGPGTGHAHDAEGRAHEAPGHSHGDGGVSPGTEAHGPAHGPVRRLRRLAHALRHTLRPHRHDAAETVDATLATSAEGLRALWISLGVLAATAAAQLAVVALSGSVALLGDTVHNGADALTALPLAAAFVLGRRAANRRFTYGFGRAEDLAGIVVVLTVAASAAFTCWSAIDRLAHPREMTHVPVVAAAALLGFAGNEWVARHRIRVGRRIGSAALVADGLHARTDGFTSLAVLLGAGGAALGWRAADPLVGLGITAAIGVVTWQAARQVCARLMDAVDPRLADAAEAALARTPGVRRVGRVRLRWIGHALHAEADIEVAADLTVAGAHAVAVDAEHALMHAVPRLVAATVHTDPAGVSHEALRHHRDPARSPR